MKRTCILVLGMHRSGTSALSGVLNILDVYFGSALMKPNRDVNPKGFYENEFLYKINEQLLSEIGSSWDDVFFNESKLKAVEDVSELEQLLESEFQYSPLFAIKDPRLAYLFPLYARALKNLGVEIKVIIPFRNPLEVARSLKARNGFSLEKGLLLWAYHFLLSEKVSRNYPRVFTRFDELVLSPEKVIELIDQEIELNISSKFDSKKDQVQEFLTSDLKHHNVSMDELSESVPEIICDIVNQFSCLNESRSPEKLDSLRNQLSSIQALFYNADVLKSLEELTQAKQMLEAKDQDLTQAKQMLEAKDQDLTQAKQMLEAKDQELMQTKQMAEAKDQELTQARQVLQAKDQELMQVKRGLRSSDTELAQTNKRLQSKDREFEVLKIENNNISNEMISLYLSKSWRLTRGLRYFARKIVKYKSTIHKINCK